MDNETEYYHYVDSDYLATILRSYLGLWHTDNKYYVIINLLWTEEVAFVILFFSCTAQEISPLYLKWGCKLLNPMPNFLGTKDENVNDLAPSSERLNCCSQRTECLPCFCSRKGLNILFLKMGTHFSDQW